MSRSDSSAGGWLGRLFSRNAAILLGRNTVVSIAVFLLGLVLLWLAVEYAGAAKVPAAGVTFLISTSLHYALGRSWIFRGTERRMVAGYAYFIANALIGLVVTMALFAALIRYTPINYLVARVAVSMVAGLVMFVLNAALNFRRL